MSLSRNGSVGLILVLRPELVDGFVKEAKHTALSDIRESIEELRYYKENFFLT